MNTCKTRTDSNRMFRNVFKNSVELYMDVGSEISFNTSHWDDVSSSFLRVRSVVYESCVFSQGTNTNSQLFVCLTMSDNSSFNINLNFGPTSSRINIPNAK